MSKILRGLIISLTLLLLGFNTLKSQVTKHQIGINASKFIILFNEQVNNLDLTYRLRLDSLYNARIAFSGDLSSAEDGLSDVSLRIGLDRYFLNKTNWKYYAGFDFNYGRTNLKSSQRINSNYGGFIFIGFLFQIGNHFSVSTEPTLAFLRFKVSDSDDFSPNANRSWSELKLLNIGQIKLSFHF